MRFSAVQEDGYGVGLGQETPPNDVDESMMAATGDVEPGGGSSVEEGSMISNLPLLFANGYPTSLEKITLPQLERFITFMVQCSLGHDTVEEISEPQWWPKEVKFSIPLIKPKKMNENYMDNLKKLVFRCYTYHRSEYLLRFCCYLAQYPHDKLEYVNNWDSTTSLYLKTTGKLLVTFRNENMNYDRIIEGPRRMLLSANKTKTNYPNGTKCLRRRSARQAPSPAMVEPPTDDIYLCDNCDAEFIGLFKMKEHEKLCYRVEPRPLTPIDLEGEPEIQQDQFMEYFKLKSSNVLDSNRGTNATAFGNDNSIKNRTSSRIRGSVNLNRCPTIPFSSPAGLALGKKSKMMTEITQQERLERIERHLNAPPLCNSFKPKWLTKIYEFDRWSVTYKPKSDKSSNNEYVHKYKFNNFNKKPVLDLRSQLLYVACKPIYVVMEVLSVEELEALKREPSRYKSPERKVPRIRPRSPSVEPLCEPELADKSNIIVIDLDDDEEPLLLPSTPLASPPPPPPPLAPCFRILPSIAITPVTRPPVATVTPMPVKNRTTLKRPRATSTPSNSNKSIIYVDLCSSDEEDVDSMCATTTINKNLDPRHTTTTVTTTMTSTTEVCVDSNYLHNSLRSPSKVCAKPCIYPADSTSSWLSNLNVSEPRRDSFLKHTPVLNSTP